MFRQAIYISNSKLSALRKYIIIAGSQMEYACLPVGSGMTRITARINTDLFMKFKFYTLVGGGYLNNKLPNLKP